MNQPLPEFEEFHTKVVFYRIPKNAGTSICTHLSHINLLNFHKRDLREKFKDPTYIKPDEFKDGLVGENLKNYFSFCVVRNPWDRVVSAYFSSDQKYSFVDFCRNGAENLFGIGKQIDWLTGKYPPNKILSFENIKDEFSNMIKNHGILNVHFELPQINKTDHDHYSKYYTKETKEIVDSLFKEDIDALDYSFDNFNIEDSGRSVTI